MAKKTAKFEVIPPETQITLPISGAFHRRLVGLYFNLCNKYDNDKLVKLAKAAADNELDSLPSDSDREDAYCLETLIILLRDSENTFRKDGHIMMNEMELPSED